ncbi:Sorting nexin, cytoplasm-to-vacuole targeting pathway/endosomal sorting, partial [Coemansia sp. RSA 2131]
ARWMDCELFTNKYANQFSTVIERNERRIYRKLGELSSDYAELGATLNGFSLLDHSESLAAAVEQAGQAVDNSYIEIGELLTQMETDVGEPVHQYAQYSLILKQVLRFRLLKNLQLEGVESALVRERGKLESLLQADDEAKRLAQALESNHHSRRHTVTAQSADGHSLSAPARDQDDDESLLSDAMQQQGFVTPQQANTEATRSRGHSVSSAMSAGVTDFTPTLAPRAIPETSGSPSMQPSSLKALHLHQRARPRSGTAASIASDVTNRRSSNGWAAVSANEAESEDDDPLAQFQKEESQMWGGGAASTLPRLGARSRGQLKQQSSSQRNSQAVDDADVYDIYPEQQPALAQSEYISRNALDVGEHAHAFGGKMAASTPSLWDAADKRDVAGDHLRPPLPTTGGAGTSTSTTFGVRLLRSPKVLGDGIMNRLTYALNGMMDVDPEQMRHNQIGRASDKISLLEDQLEMLSNDMALVNTSTQDNLDRFQKQKVCDLKGALIAMARMHLEWAEKNLEIWKEAKIAVDQV